MAVEYSTLLMHDAHPTYAFPEDIALNPFRESSERSQPRTCNKIHRPCSQIFGVVHGPNQVWVVQAGCSDNTVIHGGHRLPFPELLGASASPSYHRLRAALPSSSGEGLLSA